MSSQVAVQQEQQKRPPGMVAKIWGGFTKIAGILFASLLLSIVIEWVGMAFYWTDEGHMHARNAYETELSYLNQGLKDSLLKRAIKASPREVAEEAGRTIYHVFMKTLYMQDLIRFLRRQEAAQRTAPRGRGGGVREGAETIYKIAIDVLLSSIYITLLFFTRLVVLLFSTPAFLAFALFGFVDGLAMRDIRRWSAGRESSWVYHHAKRALPFMLAAPWVIYLAMPVSIQPSLIIIPFALLTGLIVQVTVSMFKKYI